LERREIEPVEDGTRFVATGANLGGARQRVLWPIVRALIVSSNRADHRRLAELLDREPPRGTPAAGAPVEALP
jgi:hypothetical protein